jgi:GxxExxY protein
MIYKHSKLTGQIIAAFYDVYNALGSGFLEKVYENALAYELRQRGHDVKQQIAIDVTYKDVVVGHYVADLLVDGTVVVEMKAVEKLAPAHSAQLINYLRATGLEIGLLLNCGPQPEVRRKIYDKARTKSIPKK